MAKKMILNCFARVYKALTSRLSQVSIKKKLLLSGTSTLLITSVVISSVLIHQSYRLMMDKTAVQTRSSLEQVVNGYEQMLVRQYSVLESLKNYEPLYEYMDASFSSDYDEYSAFMRSVWPGLKLISSSVGEMDIRLYSDRPNGKFSHLTSGSLEEWNRAPWFSADIMSCSDVRWEGYVSAAEGKQRLTCSLVLQRTRQGEPRMLATVFLDEAAMSSLIDTSESAVFLLLDDAGRVVSSNVEACVGLSRAQLERATGFRPDDANGTYFQGQRMYAAQRALSMSNMGIQGWRMVKLVPYSQVAASTWRMVVHSACISMAILAASLVVLLVLCRDVSERIGQLLGKIQAFGRGDVREERSVTGTDEIAQISQCVDAMETRILQLMADNARIYEQLMERLRTEQELVLSQRNAELNALCAQINPHFLFNTLETIRMNLLLRGDRETAHVIQVLSKCIREYMDDSRPMAILEDELRTISQYLFILKYRFGESLNVRIEIDRELYGQSIPRLILQPVIENAVRYSLESKPGAGQITLRAALQGGQLCFYVQDDGMGISEEKLEELRRAFASEQGMATHGEHLGLRNINRRIRLLYGEEYGVEIQSRLGEGTLVILRLRASED